MTLPLPLLDECVATIFESMFFAMAEPEEGAALPAGVPRLAATVALLRPIAGEMRVELGEGVPLLVGVVEPDGVLLGEAVCVRVCEGEAATAPTGANATERKCVLAGATATTREVKVTVFQATTREAPDVYSTAAGSRSPGSAGSAAVEAARSSSVHSAPIAARSPTQMSRAPGAQRIARAAASAWRGPITHCTRAAPWPCTSVCAFSSG